MSDLDLIDSNAVAPLAASRAEISSHSTRVKTFFEAPDGYFNRRQFDVRIRTETVRFFTRDQRLEDVLDIGCGNGDISLPLLERPECRRLMLLDLSATMLALARSRVEPGREDRVEFVNDDVLSVDFGATRFDLIVCTGVLAHVERLDALLERMVALLKPHGSLVVEVTDSFHPVGRVLALYQALLDRFRPATYRLNRLRARDVAKSLRSLGMAPTASFRYAHPPPGSQRIASHETLLRVTRTVFGTPAANRLRWLGNITIGKFDKT